MFRRVVCFVPILHRLDVVVHCLKYKIRYLWHIMVGSQSPPYDKLSAIGVATSVADIYATKVASPWIKAFRRNASQNF